MNYIFFDIDGTLHKEDIFLEFIQFSISKRLFNIVLFFPLILLFLLIYLVNNKGVFALNAILFLIFWGAKPNHVECMIDEFCCLFIQKMTLFKPVFDVLNNHLLNGDNIVLISGTPMALIEKIYPQFFENKNMTVIASITVKKYFSFYLEDRCIYKNKKVMLNKKFNRDVRFLCGYSDSLSDISILSLCENPYLVDKYGNINKMNV